MKDKDRSEQQLMDETAVMRRYIIELEASEAKNKRVVERLQKECRMLTGRLDKANRLKEEFLDHVSHEFRTPLAIIKGSIDTIRAFPDISCKERNELIDLVVPETERLSRMIEDLLDIAKIETGQLVLNKQVHDLSGTARRSLEILSRRIDAKKISVQKKGFQGKYLSYIDLDRITDVINNLVNNAVNYTPEGGDIKINLSIEKIDGKTYNLIDVSNPGERIQDDKLDSVFEDFYRMRKFLRAQDRDEYIKGVGMGLYLSKKIINMHDGMIKVKSAHESGSTFSVYLPAVEQKEAKDG